MTNTLYTVKTSPDGEIIIRSTYAPGRVILQNPPVNGLILTPRDKLLALLSAITDHLKERETVSVDQPSTPKVSW